MEQGRTTESEASAAEARDFKLVRAVPVSRADPTAKVKTVTKR
jgi:hypothetical protein